MKNIIVPVAFLLCIAGSYAATPLPPAKHSAVKTASQPVKTVAFTPSQKNSVDSALKALRKLGAATEVGVSQSDYQSRSIDTKAEVDEDLRSIPTGKAQTDISDSMQAYMDASRFWNECQQIKNRGQILQNDMSSPLLSKYGLILQQFGQAEIDAQAKDQAEHDKCDTELQQLQDGDSQQLQNGTTISDDRLAQEQSLLEKIKDLTQKISDDASAQFDINDTDEKKLLSGIWEAAAVKETDGETTLK